MADKKLISIDLETLGTQDDSVILAIGIAVGTSNGDILEKFQVFPTVDAQILEGRKVSGETVLWWLKQDEAACQEQAQAKRLPVDTCREHVRDFFAKHPDVDFILGNAPSFDCDMLAHFLGSKPWEWYKERDVRTARMKVPVAERAPNHAEHSALADAIAQLQDFATFMRK